MAAISVRQLPLAGVMLIEPFIAADERGQFVKTFHSEMLAEHGLMFELREEFYSVSRRGVLRGMHFQRPPCDHQKLVSCESGRALDVVLDLRTKSPTYGRHCSLELCGATPQLVWIPRGVAHGFLSLEDHTRVSYKTDREHAASHDDGILWSSFGFDWPVSADDVVLSERDRRHPTWIEFVSPFS